MKIGIVGSGVVGVALAKGFLKHGYDVMISSNTPSKLAALAEQVGKGTKTGSFAEAAKFGELVVLTVKASAAESVIKGLATALAGKVVIDTTNPIADAPPANGALVFFTGPSDSMLERLQKAAPQAKLVKSFSCIGSAFMVNPKFADGKPTMFICGNDAGAKASVSKIVEQFGFDAEDMGGVEGARGIEPLCILWCLPGIVRNDWVHAFKLLKK